MVQSSSALCISVDCLLLCIEEESAEESQSTTPSHFTAFLDWVTITKPNGMNYLCFSLHTKLSVINQCIWLLKATQQYLGHTVYKTAEHSLLAPFQHSVPQ